MKSYVGVVGTMIIACLLFPGQEASAAPETWKVGLARSVITPKQPVWMAGYGSREAPGETALHDLWIRVLVLEDSTGHRAMLMATDLCGFSRTVYESVFEKINRRFGLDQSQVALCASHTHCSPLIRDFEVEEYKLDEARLAAVEKYTDLLESKIMSATHEALSNMVPARLFWGQGQAEFAVNRRNNSAKDVPKLLGRGESPKGPIDHSVPLLAVRSTEGDKLLALVFGYACHNTTLEIDRWCGDYSGFAQLELERSHPGAVAMFTMGCGGDQNPIPRRTIELCQKYGRQLAAAVDKVLSGKMEPLDARLSTAFEELRLGFDTLYSREKLEECAGNKFLGLKQKLAREFLKLLDAGRPQSIGYPYPVLVWKLGRDKLWVLLAGEVVVDYSLLLKRRLGPEVRVTAYVNDVMEYIPSRRVLREGGYEGEIRYNLPANRWADGIEQRIIDCVTRLVKRVTVR